MRFKSWRGLSATYRRAVEGPSPWRRDLCVVQSLMVSDVAADPITVPFLPLLREEGIGALGFIPLVAGGQLIGRLTVYFHRPRVLGPQELDLARAIADHVAAAISRFTAVAELQQTVRFNELFTGILGHDLRNPLTGIITAAQHAMSREEGLPLAKPLSRILSSGARMTRMIDQLLDFTRVRLGAGLPLDRQTIDLVPLLRQAMDELEDAHPAWSFRLDARGDTRGSWDGDRLSQVFSNLIANAVQHGDPGEGVRVTVDGAAAEAIRIGIENRGTIPAPLLPRIFEPLSGGSQRRAGSQGLGLGLYITREIVRSHGGEIEVRSAGEATCFSARLPREPPVLTAGPCLAERCISPPPRSGSAG